ncbi:MAG: U32 family peptidase, partial [Desulfovibrio sp.]|nr:U32 family peptidase [Desulfovibrio sp.]
LRSKKEKSARFFSCQDLAVEQLTQNLLEIPHLNSWKIEGRKKGPHYVYHCVAAYKLLRDEPKDAKAIHEALELLNMALGRPTTRARLTDQGHIPTNPRGVTSSGLIIGYTEEDQGLLKFKTKCDLLAKDFLRLGSEEMSFHQTLALKQNHAKGSLVPLKLNNSKHPPRGTPVFLIDRREQKLSKQIKELKQKLSTFSGSETKEVHTKLRLPPSPLAKKRPDMRVLSTIPQGRDNKASSRQMLALWLGPKTIGISKTVARRVYFWLPPVVWPSESRRLGKMVAQLWLLGCRHFVLNAPWQRAFFPSQLSEGSDLVAGPFCNLANALSLNCVAKLGFKAAFISPELPAKDILKLPKVSPLPLGFVLEGFWPVGISRFGVMGLKPNTPFQSPKGEIFWTRNYGQNLWIYPAWPLNLKEKEEELRAAGYSFFASLKENTPPNLPATKRPGLFNWSEQLL